MDIARATQLCQSALDQNRSHMITVDRYTLTQLMVNRVELTQEISALKSKNGDLEKELEKSNSRIMELEKEKANV